MMLRCLAPESLCFQIQTSEKRVQQFVTGPVQRLHIVAKRVLCRQFLQVLERTDSSRLLLPRSREKEILCCPLTDSTRHIGHHPSKRRVVLGGARLRHQPSLDYILTRFLYGLRYLQCSCSKYWTQTFVREKCVNKAEIREEPTLHIFLLF